MNLKLKTNKLIIVSIFLLLSLNALAQVDSIEIKRTIIGTMFKHQGKFLSPLKLFKVTKSDVGSQKEMTLAKKFYMTTLVVDGVLIASLPAVVVIGATAYFVIILGSVCIATTSSFLFLKHAKIGVKIYNKDLKKLGMINNRKIYLRGAELAVQQGF